MRNCIIIGSGRSGTSALGGMLANSGYFLGDNLLKTTINNPKGYFEDYEVNYTNELILKQKAFKRPPILGRYLFRRKPVFGQRWLYQFDLQTDFRLTKPLKKRINSILDNYTSHEPFAIKDPRFSYTLNVWKPLLNNNIGYICIFREPEITAASMLKFIDLSGDSNVLDYKFEDLLILWTKQYQFILEKLYIEEKNWLFVHYNQLFETSKIRYIEAFLNVKLNDSFMDKSLNRTHANAALRNEEVSTLYKKLCQLASFKY